jgi:hypothetical protein
MFKFFRALRKNLLATSQTRKYLKYAIGEIILVVIGILIALSINNWNQERINSAKSEELLRGMCKDLSQDITTLDRMIYHYEDRMAFFERHIHKTDFSDMHTDTLIQFFDGGAGSFNITAQSFDKVKNLGISQICSNDSLSDRIDNYYTRTLEFTKTVVKYDQNETVKENDFWMNEPIGIELNYHEVKLDFPVLQDSLERKKNILTLITSPRGRNHIRMECVRKELVLEHHKGIRDTAQELRRAIEDYLTH